MRYMVIVKATKESEAEVFPSQELMAEMATFYEGLAKAGVLLDASGLHASSRGWRVRYSGGKGEVEVVDGPFAETKELIAGYTLIEVKSREEAIEWSRRFPNPVGAGRPAELEVRQVIELDDVPQGEVIDRFKELEKGKR